MIEARITLESLIARRAAERVTENDIKILREILDSANTLVAVKNIEAVVNLDFRLHSYIARCSGNDYIAVFSTQINSSMLRYWHLSSRNAETLPSWESNHEDLVRAIASGDPDRAEDEARRHVCGLRKLLRELLM
jgi:DNA-binding GntR family transcriptional regulator